MKSQALHPKSHTTHSRSETTHLGSQATHSKDIVLSFVEALNNDDFESARTYISDDMVFKGVMANLNGGDKYMKDMEKMKIKYAVKKVAAGDDDVSLLYDFTQSGTTIPGCGWYHVADGKIDSLTVLFDPRPFIK